MKSADLMTPREKRAVSGKKPTKADEARKQRLIEEEANLLNESKMVRNAFRKAASKKVVIKDDDGTDVEVRKIDVIATNYVNHYMEKDNAGKINVKEIMAIDDPDKNVVSLESATEIFGGIVAGAKPNGADIESSE